MNENLKKKKISKNSESCENNLNSALIFFLEIIHHKNFFCKLLLRKTFYKLVLWIIFFKCCKLSSDIFLMFIVDRLYQILQFVVPIVVFQDTFFCKRPECFGITARYCSIF